MRARLIMEYSKWARQKNKNILTEPKEGLKIWGGQSIIAGLMYDGTGFAPNSAKISGPIANQPPPPSPVPPALSY